MAAKKKPVKRDLVTPNPKTVKVGVKFEELAEGEYFIMDGELWQKPEENSCDQAAINALNGEIREDLCEEIIIPVNVTIAWETK